MKFIAIAALFLATAMAVPTEYYPGGNDGGDGGMTGGDYPSGGDNNGGGDDGSDSGSDGGSGGMAYQPCASGLYSNSQCCATNVLGVAALDCENPEGVPTSPDDFEDRCAMEGKAPLCCLLPVLGQSVLCVDPQGL